MQRPQSCEKRLLCNIGGIVGRAYDGAGECVHAVLVTAHELAKGGLVAALGATHECELRRHRAKGYTEMATALIWHGYLLGGTGSNIYTANIAREWVSAGHDVVLMCQELYPERLDFVHRCELVSRQELTADISYSEPAAGDGTCVVVKPDIADLLPVYVLDRYAGFQVKRFPDLGDDELQRYVQLQREAVAGVLRRYDVDGALINHAFMGPEALRPVLQEAGIPYVVKVHGSELEYSATEDDRYIQAARSGLAGARRILVGSRHMRQRLEQIVGSDSISGRVEISTPGVDLDVFTVATSDADRHQAQQQLVELLHVQEQPSSGFEPAHRHRLEEEISIGTDDLVQRLAGMHGTYEERDVDALAAEAVGTLDPARDRIVAYVGKLIPQKGPQLALAAFPLIAAHEPRARMLIAGFGPLREGLEAMVAALSTGDLGLLRYIVEHGNAFGGGPAEPFEHLPAFYERLSSEGLLDDYTRAAADIDQRVVFTGAVNHLHLSALWRMCTCTIVPSIFPEAFGMVAAESAAAGCPPVIAEHSGLSDVVRALRMGAPDWAHELLAFSLDSEDPVRDLAAHVGQLCSLDQARHDELRLAQRAVVQQQWAWRTIAEKILLDCTAAEDPEVLSPDQFVDQSLSPQ